MKNVKLQVQLPTKRPKLKKGVQIDVGVCTGDSLFQSNFFIENKPTSKQTGDAKTVFQSFCNYQHGPHYSQDTVYMSCENYDMDEKGQIFGDFSNKKQKKQDKNNKEYNKKIIRSQNNVTNVEISLLSDSVCGKMLMGIGKKSREEIYQQDHFRKESLGRRNDLQQKSQQKQTNILSNFQETQVINMKPKFNIKQYFQDITPIKQQEQDMMNVEMKRKLIDEYISKNIHTQYKKSKFRFTINQPENSISQSKYSFNTKFGFSSQNDTKVDLIIQNEQQKKVTFCWVLNPSRWCGNHVYEQKQ